MKNTLINNLKLLLVASAAVVVCDFSAAYAQQNDALSAQGDVEITSEDKSDEGALSYAEREERARIKKENEIERRNFKDSVNSILFSTWEYVEIHEALEKRKEVPEGSIAPEEVKQEKPALVYEPEEEEVEEVAPPKVKPPEEQRYITLSGVVYTAPQDWVVWINGVAVTPKKQPDEILDIKVSKDYVELRWLDEYTEQILPVRLKLYQSFHMDKKTFKTIRSK